MSAAPWNHNLLFVDFIAAFKDVDEVVVVVLQKSCGYDPEAMMDLNFIILFSDKSNIRGYRHKL